MYVECQVGCLEWAAGEQRLRGETTMTVPAQFVPRNYDVFAGLDVDKKSMAVIFTDHEQLDSLGLVNMNGRIYDPGIGRFLSADPSVQAPTQTQNYNRYSYVVNNPLSLTDPSGFNFLNNFGRWLTNTFGKTGAQIAIGVIGVVVAVAAWYVAPIAFTAITTIATTTAAGGLSATGVFVAGVAAGFSSTFISTQLSGASISQSLELAAIAGALGGLTAGVFNAAGVGGIPDNFMDYVHDFAFSAAAGAVDGGVLSAASGGDFVQGAGLGVVFAAGTYVVVTSAVTYLYEQGEVLYPKNGSTDASSYDTTTTNGILTSRQSAQALADARRYPVFYNPTQGPINDILQSFYQKVFFGAGDSLARGYASFIEQLNWSGGITVGGYSQGTLTAVNAARVALEVFDES